MVWEMNNLQSITNGRVEWKIVTDDPTVETTGKLNGKNVFWLAMIPGKTDWQILKPNMTKRYHSDYNPTSIKRNNR